MANVGEEQITRLTREQLVAIKHFLQVRDSFRYYLQARQQQRVDFAANTEQFFKPITTETEKVTATEKVCPETEKVAARTKQVKKIFENYACGYSSFTAALAPAQSVPVDVQPVDVVPPSPEITDSSPEEKQK